MKTMPQTLDRLATLLHDGPRSISSVRAGMMPEGYTGEQIEEAARILNVKLAYVGKGRSKMPAWQLPVKLS